MKTIGNLLIILFVIASVYIVKDDALVFFQKLKLQFQTEFVKDTAKLNDSLANPETDVLTPGPLRSLSGILKLNRNQTPLTLEGVVEWTNKHRADNNLPALTVNTKLNQSAKLKLDDMFAKQYFEHDSPEGKGVSDLGEEVGYDYIVIGENLALGDFANDEDLVMAWMNSPGHRKNILHDRYTEIGVAVGKGMYQGNMTWLAVQYFAMPKSACPSIDSKLKIQIQANQQKLTRLENEITTSRAELDHYSGDAYQQQVVKYNAQVASYNSLINATKTLIAKYNAQVNAFNECANL